MKDSRKGVVFLARGVCLEPIYREQMLDCRLFLLGDRYRQLLRAYEEIVYRLSRGDDVESKAAEVLESPEIRHYYHVAKSDDCVSLTLHDAAFCQQYSLNSGDFALRISGGPRPVAVPLPLGRFRALGSLLPMLAGSHGESEITARLQESLSPDEQGWARELLAKLDEQRCLDRGSVRPNSFLVSPTRPRVTFVGHTSILLQSAGAAILTDPLLRSRFGSPERAFDLTRLDLTAICCTHAHWDHCDVETLLRFDKRIPVIIPRVRQATAFNPPISPVLGRLGFQNVRELEPWESVQLGDVEMILVPFHGEQDEAGAEIDHYTYVFRTPGLSLYGGVDAYRDTFGDMHGVLQRVRAEYSPTVAFLPISRLTYSYRHGGVNGFCRYIDSSLLNEKFQYTAGAPEAAEWVRLLGASIVVPYATFAFYPSATSAKVDEFAAALDQKALGAALLPLRPLDSLDLSDLDGSARSARRRRLLLAWNRVGARASAMDRSLGRHAAYRFARRLVARSGSNASSHQH